MNALQQLAEAAGLTLRWRDYRGAMREVAPDTLRHVLTALGFPCAGERQIADSLAQARHERSDGEEAGGTQPTCMAVAELSGGRKLWGLTAQLYALRRPGDGGLGDFTALADFAQAAAAEGAQAIGVSPVHALFSADPGHYSPYSPSSRLLCNVLHADPADAVGGDQVRDLTAMLGLADEFAALEEADLVDWPRAAAARLKLLRAAFRALPDAARGRLGDYRRERGAMLEDHARFEAMHAAQFAEGRWHWRDWPAALRDARSAAVADFAREYAGEVEFHVFLQWLAELGLAKAQAAARAGGMAVGLIADLAVGADAGGSRSWSRPDEMLDTLSLGAPPDMINGQGQNWGLTTYSPRALRTQQCEPFAAMLRAALRHAGGVRIDHVMGLQRLWVIPDGAKATEGVYIAYPFRQLLRVIAEESRRHRALIIGEDLGTVPENFRERLGAAGIMGMRVLWFEREHDLFIEPTRWPDHAMATTTTHDLPTVAGWWSGRDISHRLHARQVDDAEQELQARARDRQTLWNAFRYADVARTAMPDEPDTAVDAAIRFVARTPAPLALIPIEDIAGLEEQPNLPGTTDEHPNWRRRLPDAGSALLARPRAAERLALLRKERGSSDG